MSQAAIYKIADLGILGGAASDGWGLNNAGYVVGVPYLGGDAAQHAFLYNQDSMTDLGTLGGQNSWA